MTKGQIKMTSRKFRNKATLIACAVSLAVFPVSLNAKDQFHFRFLPLDGQELTWNRGVPSIDSAAEGSIVRLIDAKDRLPDDQTTFRISVLNTGDAPIDIDPSNIWIEDAEGNRVAMLSHEELEGRHRRDVKRRQALAVLGGALSAGSANGYTSGTYNYSGTTSNGTYFNGFGTYSAYDPALAAQQRQAATAQSQATFNAIQVRQLAGAEALNGMLRMTTLQPGEITSGIVAFDPPKSLRKQAAAKPATIVVKIGDAEHRFQVNLVELP